jgi:hypothetical protein
MRRFFAVDCDMMTGAITPNGPVTYYRRAMMSIGPQESHRFLCATIATYMDVGSADVVWNIHRPTRSSLLASSCVDRPDRLRVCQPMRIVPAHADDE